MLILLISCYMLISPGVVEVVSTVAYWNKKIYKEALLMSQNV